MSQEIGIVLLGIIAGIMSGMFGIGGGVIIVPILTAVFAFPLIEAGGTSLAALMMPVGIFAVISYYREKMINIKVAAIFSLGILVEFRNFSSRRIAQADLRNIFIMGLLAIFRFPHKKASKRNRI